ALPTCNSPVGLGAKRTFMPSASSSGALEGIGHRIAAIPSEGARGNLDARRCLPALVLGILQQAPYPVHLRTIVTARHDRIHAGFLLDQTTQDGIEIG